MAREIKPNTFQKFLHRFVMLRPVTAFFAGKTHIIDKAIFKLSKGKHSFSEYLGWNIIQITTIGAKTGKPHQLVLLALVNGKNLASLPPILVVKITRVGTTTCLRIPLVMFSIMEFGQNIPPVKSAARNMKPIGKWQSKATLVIKNIKKELHTAGFR